MNWSAGDALENRHHGHLPFRAHHHRWVQRLEPISGTVAIGDDTITAAILIVVGARKK